MTRGSKHLNKNIFLPSASPSIHPPSPQKVKNNPACELQFDARFPAAMGMCGRQPGSLATGCSYLRLVQTWLHLYLHPAAGCSVGQRDLQLIHVNVGVLKYHLHEWSGKQDLKGVRTGEERVTPKEKCLCFQSIV